MSGWAWWAAAGGALVALALFRRPLAVLGRLERLGLVGGGTGPAPPALRPLAVLGRLALRSGLGLVFLWLFQGVGAVLGVTLGVNLLNGLVLGVLGPPGFALLLLTQWAGR